MELNLAALEAAAAAELACDRSGDGNPLEAAIEAYLNAVKPVEIFPVQVRLLEPLYKRIVRHAKVNERSIFEEIVAALEKSFPDNADQAPYEAGPGRG